MRRDRVVVGLFCAVAALLRVPTLGRAYWIDEAISVGIASHPLAQLPPLLRNDGSPPLWYVVLHGWMVLFGTSPLATHSLSLVLGIIAVPAFYWAGREIFGRTAGLAAAGLAATNPLMIWYSTQTRMYVLVVSLAAVAVALAVRADRRRTWGSLAAAAIAYAALDYSHYWGLYLTVATAAWLAVRALRARDRTLGIGVVAGSLATFALYLPWLPSFLEQASNTADPWALPPSLLDLVVDPAVALGGTVGAAGLVVVVWAVWRTRGHYRGRRARDAGLVAGLAAVTTVLGWVGAQAEPSWTVRYLAATVGPWLLAGAGALAASRLGRRVLVAACVGMSLVTVVTALLPNPNPTAVMDNASAVTAAAAPFLRPGDLVVVTQTEQTPVVAYELGAGMRYDNPMGPVADPSVVNWRDIVARLDRARACRTIGPSVAALPVGTAVLEIDPLEPVGAAGSAWAAVTHRQVASIERLLATDPALRAEHSFTNALSPKPYSPVIGELFVKVRPGGGCS